MLLCRRLFFFKASPFRPRSGSVLCFFASFPSACQFTSWSPMLYGRTAYSIEFFGGTHVDKNSDIQQLAILEDTGIVSNFEMRLAYIERMILSPEKEDLIKHT
ncbi:hypothetical protein F4680DRAFT_430511 [Xylaria scruposa]|nr:hypothetical protein F4680DRAFT_430511 [Xylaria scruposa]